MTTQLIAALLAADVIEVDDIMVGRNFDVTEPMQSDDAEEWDDDCVRFESKYVDDDELDEHRWLATGEDLVAAVYTGRHWLVRAGEEDEFKVRCYRLKLLRPDQKQESWADDYIQFARLLAEIKMAGVGEEQLKLLKQSMDLEAEQICEILDRAEERFEEIKAAT